jgi:hypothetical protein
MKIHRMWGALVLAMVLGPTAPASAQDALRGKRFYLDTARLTGASVSCVDCHRELPPGLFGIGRAANNAAIVANALNTIPQMAPLRGRLAAADITDLAEYIGNPGVPSPSLRLGTRSPSGTESSDRLDFGVVLPGQTAARGMLTLANDGALPIQLMSSVRIVGPHADEYVLADNSCVIVTALGSGQSCEIGITFRPALGGTGLRSGALQIDHDWVGGTAAIALLGAAETTAANPPVAASGGGGALGGWWMILIASAAAVRDRSHARRRWSRLYRHQ